MSARSFLLVWIKWLSIAAMHCPGQEPIRKGIPVEHIDPTPSQQQRRERSEAICVSKHIPLYTNPNALFVETDEQIEIRTKDDVVNRSLALCYYALKVIGTMPADREHLRGTYRVEQYLTPNEKRLVAADQPTPQQRNEADWSFESLHVLLWALGYVDSLQYPDALCTVEQDIANILKRDDRTFRKQVHMRRKGEILDQADLILRFHWACREAQINGEQTPGGLNDDVVIERHRALNWLIRYMDLDWDDVTTDT